MEVNKINKPQAQSVSTLALLTLWLNNSLLRGSHISTVGYLAATQTSAHQMREQMRLIPIPDMVSRHCLQKLPNVPGIDRVNFRPYSHHKQKLKYMNLNVKPKPYKNFRKKPQEKAFLTLNQADFSNIIPKVQSIKNKLTNCTSSKLRTVSSKYIVKRM